MVYLGAAFLFVFIFATMVKDQKVSAGIAYGAFIKLLASGTLSCKQYALYPIPLVPAAWWFTEGMLQYFWPG